MAVIITSKGIRSTVWSPRSTRAFNLDAPRRCRPLGYLTSTELDLMRFYLQQHGLSLSLRLLKNFEDDFD